MSTGDLSVRHSGGVGRPAPSAGSGTPAGSGVATVTGFAGESGYGPCTHGPYPNTGDPRRTESSKKAWPTELGLASGGPSVSHPVHQVDADMQSHQPGDG
jgi:hypothetical protein